MSRVLNKKKCEYCGKSFSQPEYLKKHIHTVHEGKKDHKCVFCEKLFSQSGNLKRHITSVHTFEEYQ